jgi:roadblock/LC7 domain-containing protein
MIKQLLALDGVFVICHFRDDGALVEGYGMMDESQMSRLAKFAHDYKRMVQGNTDQFSMFTGLPGWAPPGGWIVRGVQYTVCSVGNLVCFIDHGEASLNEVMRELTEASHY